MDQSCFDRILPAYRYKDMHISVMDIPAFILLIIFAVTDMKTRTIWKPAAIAGMIVGLLIRILLPAYRLLDGIGGILGGGLLFLMSWLSKEAIGRGDCYILCAIGAFYGFAGMTELFFIALLLASCWAVYLLVCKKANRKTSFPFIPFLFLGWTLTRFFSV